MLAPRVALHIVVQRVDNRFKTVDQCQAANRQRLILKAAVVREFRKAQAGRTIGSNLIRKDLGHPAVNIPQFQFTDQPGRQLVGGRVH